MLSLKALEESPRSPPELPLSALIALPTGPPVWLPWNLRTGLRGWNVAQLVAFTEPWLLSLVLSASRFADPHP